MSKPYVDATLIDIQDSDDMRLAIAGDESALLGLFDYCKSQFNASERPEDEDTEDVQQRLRNVNEFVQKNDP